MSAIYHNPSYTNISVTKFKDKKANATAVPETFKVLFVFCTGNKQIDEISTIASGRQEFFCAFPE